MRPRPPENTIIRTALVVVVAVLVMVGGGCQRSPAEGQEDDLIEKAAGERAASNEVALSPEAVQKAGIRIEVVREQVLTPSFRVPARVAYNEEATAHVGTPVVGRVTEIKVKLGDVVNKGDDLLVIESRELGEAQSDFLQKLAAVTVARDAVMGPKTALDRGKLLEGKAVSSAEVQKREAEYRAAMGSLRAAEVASTAAEQKLRLLGMDDKAVGQLAATGHLTPRYTVRAPISGTVVQREVTLGELVIPEKEVLLVLTDMSTLWVMADVPEARLRQVAQGTGVRVHVAASEQPLDGDVSLVSPSVNPGTRTVAVRVEIKDGRGLLVPGMFAEAEIAETRADVRTPVLAIPEAAVQTIGGDTVVFVPGDKSENTFVTRTIRRGRNVGSMVQILSGLRPGERIVTDGSLVLKGELGKAGAGQDDDD